MIYHDLENHTLQSETHSCKGLIFLYRIRIFFLADFGYFLFSFVNVQTTYYENKNFFNFTYHTYLFIGFISLYHTAKCIVFYRNASLGIKFRTFSEYHSRIYYGHTIRYCNFGLHPVLPCIISIDF